jgi:serine/threonine-protein kinase
MPPLNPDLWPRLSPLLDRAFELDPAGCDELLSAVRAEDPELGAALEGLLARHRLAAAADFLESGALGDRLPASLEGQTVGGYTLVRPLGMGGMGTVWLARRSDGRFEGNVAVKFVNLAVLDELTLERFRREGTVLARLSHPHIARLFDAGMSDAGQPYLVLEYVEGTRIDRYAAERRLGVAARLELFLQVAEAVAHAHANLVVHRDLKPSNILVDRDGQAKLLDFGVSGLLGGAAAGAPSTLTLAGSRALTPEHAAPEQLAGGVVTTATDVYALGVLLYQSLSGRHPTGSDGATPAAVLRALIEQEPRRLSETVRQLRPADPEAQRILTERDTTRDRLRRACRGDLDTILGKALQKDPAARYQTVTAVADDIRRHLRHEPVAARPDSIWYRTRKLIVRRRIEIGAAAAIAVALLAGIGLALVQARQSARERDRALEMLRRAEATNEFSGFLLTEATPRGKPISQGDLLQAGEAVIAKRFGGDPVLRVHMLLVLAARYQENQQFEPWRRVLQRAYDESRSIDDAGLRAYATCAWALQFIEQEEARKGLAAITEALPAVAGRPEYVEYESGCRVLESIAARRAGDTARAVVAADRALALEAGRPGVPAREVDAMMSLANALSQVHRYTDANVAYRRVVDTLDAQGLRGSRQMAVALNNWSSNLIDAGQVREGVEVAARAVAAARATDSENGASLSMLMTYGAALSATGNHVSAAVALDEALAKARAANARTRLIATLGSAVSAACAAGDVERGRRLLSEAESLVGPETSAYSKGLVEASTARVALAAGDRARAIDWARRAVNTLNTATLSRNGLLPAQTVLARALNADGRHAEALIVGENCAAEAERLRGTRVHTSQLGFALLEVATARRGLGNAKAAREALDRALEHLQASVGPNAEPTVRALRLRQALAAGTGAPSAVE